MSGRTVILVLLMSHTILFANGLKCVHCRLDLCTHEYCTQSKELFNSSSTDTASYVEIEEWANIPVCPEKPEDRNKPELTQTCSPQALSCGFFNYKVSTKNLPNIVPGNQSAVPVVAGGTKSYESSVIVLGCVKSDFKCRTGLKQITNVVAVKNESSSTTDSPVLESKVNRLESINNATACCKCETDMCNLKDDMKDCSTSVIQVPQMDSPFPLPPSSGGNGIFISKIFATIMVLVNFF